MGSEDVEIEEVAGEDEESSEVLESGLIIAGSEDVQVIADIPEGISPENMTPTQQRELADSIVSNIDDHPEGLPGLPLNLGKFTVWSIECAFLPVDDPDAKPDSNPGLILTFAGPDDPRGTPFIFNRDRALKLASQLKKFANQGPSIQQRAAQSGLAVPVDAPSSGGLILPGQ